MTSYSIAMNMQLVGPPPFQQVFSHLDHGGLKSLKTEGNP